MTTPANQTALQASEPDKVSKNGWVRLGLVRSSSDLAKWYVIGQRILKTGAVQRGCDCPHQIYRLNKVGGQCKHIQAFFAAQPSTDIKYTSLGVQILTSLKLAEKVAVEVAKQGAQKVAVKAVQAA